MKIAVVLGAGASYDCWDEKFGNPDHQNWRPPLVNGLFGRESFWGLTGQYPQVRELVVEMGKMAQAGTLRLEEQLRWYATHRNKAVRDQFKWIPLYIHDAIAYCSEEYRKHAFTYSTMFQGLLNYAEAEVLVITTNYDDLAEAALSGLKPGWAFETMDHYISDAAPCKLVKHHGSIDWVYPLNRGHIEDSAQWDVAFERFAVEEVAQNRNDIWKVSDRRTNSYRWIAPKTPTENRPVFPALTAPLAGKTDADVLCPDSHLAAAQSFLAAADRILIAGTSGLDDDVARLLNRGIPNRPGRLWLVGADAEDAKRTRVNLVERGLEEWKTDGAVMSDLRFGQFIFDNEFHDFYS